MRILLVSLGYFKVPNKSGGGVEFHTYNLANALGKLGHEVHYVVDTTEKSNLHNNVIVHRIEAPDFPLRPKGFLGWAKNYFLANWYAFKKARYVLNNSLDIHFDIIHGHGNLSSFLLSKFSGKNLLIYTVHNPTPWMCNYETWSEKMIRVAVWRGVEIPLWKRAHYLIALNKDIIDEMVRLGISDKKIKVIPNGVDTNLFQAKSHYKQIITERYGLDKYCLFVGQLVQRKGVHYLLQSLTGVDIPCVIVGDGPQYANLVSLANKLGIADRVVFTGALPVEEIIPLYSSASFFVLPTIAEAFPLVLLEAMACSSPVISTRIGATPEIIRDGYNGFIVKPANVELLREKIKLLASDPILCQEMGKNARKTVEEKYSWEIVAKQTVEVYEKVREKQ